MSGAQIANDVLAALREAGTATGNGPLVAQLTPASTGGNPWDAPRDANDPVDLTVILDEFRVNEIDGTVIQAGDKKLLMDATGPEPKPGDTLTIDGVAHRLEMVWPLAPGGVAVMYTVAARRIGG